MPCFFPKQVFFTLRTDGKKEVRFSNQNARLWREGKPLVGENRGTLPCGWCVGCRMDKSQSLAVRASHELIMSPRSCFLTLTYADKFLPKDGSVRKEVAKKFMHDLRQRCARGFEYVDLKGKTQFYQQSEGIRFLSCGEYGDNFERPHYHFLIFNFDFLDRRFFKRSRGGRIYVSETLSRLWPYGHHGIGMVTFESAAYVARYVHKKIVGDLAEEHYQGRNPEFVEYSRMPGLGRPYLEQYINDIYPRDHVIVQRDRKVKVPQYYDRVIKVLYPDLWKQVSDARLERRNELSDDAFSYSQLLKKREKLVRKMSDWTRSIENGSY